MSLAQILADFKVDVLQCEALIANAHKIDSTGAPFLPEIDRKQITVAAFLNMFIAWETFLEASLAEYMTGALTLNGSTPIRYVSPVDVSAAKKMVIGVMKFFDYGNHDHFLKQVTLYFRSGYPFELQLKSIYSDLADIRIMRHAAAHITSTTQTAMETLALRLFGSPKTNITLYQLLTASDPKSTAGETIFATYKTKLIVAAELIVQG